MFCTKMNPLFHFHVQGSLNFLSHSERLSKSTSTNTCQGHRFACLAGVSATQGHLETPSSSSPTTRGSGHPTRLV